MVRGGSNQFVLAIYTQTHNATGELPHTALADTVTATIQAAGASVLDRLLVSGGLWWSYQCTDRSCCPLEGRSLPHAPTPFQAAATVAGLTVAPSRVALAARFDPTRTTPGRVAGVGAACRAGARPGAGEPTAGAARPGRGARLTTAMNTANGGAYIELADEDVARAGAALRHTVIRDAIWLELDRRGGAGDELWLDLVRRLPSPYDAAPLFLYGWSAWRRGNGTLAGMAAERALDTDPGYSAAELLLAGLRHGVNPHTMPHLGVHHDGQPGTA